MKLVNITSFWLILDFFTTFPHQIEAATPGSAFSVQRLGDLGFADLKLSATRRNRVVRLYQWMAQNQMPS